MHGTIILSKRKRELFQLIFVCGFRVTRLARKRLIGDTSCGKPSPGLVRRLVKKLDGKIELIGGSAENRTEAKEWISLFLHEAVISGVSEHKPRPRPIRTRAVAF